MWMNVKMAYIDVNRFAIIQLEVSPAVVTQDTHCKMIHFHAKVSRLIPSPVFALSSVGCFCDAVCYLPLGRSPFSKISFLSFVIAFPSVISCHCVQQFDIKNIRTMNSGDVCLNDALSLIEATMF